MPVDHRIAIDEGTVAYAATPFATTVAAYTRTVPGPALQPLPSQVGTWLIDPLKAPAISLPDLDGTMRDLQSLRGHFALVNFWATSAPSSLNQLKLLNRQRAALATSQLQVLAVNVDETGPRMRHGRSRWSKNSFSRSCLPPMR